MTREYSCRLIGVLMIISAISGEEQSKPIPGCADIDNLEVTFNLNSSSLEDLLLCFCKPRSLRTVTITCLYGSKLSDLDHAVRLAQAANRTVDRILLNHVEFDENGLGPDFFKSLNAPLTDITIGLCAQPFPLNISIDAFKGIESTLMNLSLYECQIQQVPPAIKSLPNLQKLSLSGNEITQIANDDFTGLKQLRVLNLAGNFLREIENGTLVQLENLDTLIMGERTFMNDSFLQEISQITSLETLDLSKADGLSKIPMGTFDRLKNLRKLLLNGANLVNLTNDMFKNQSNLEELDLRVNLIETIEPNTFSTMNSLRQLALAGNFLKHVSAEHFNGLNSLEMLDLGWNEIKQIEDGVFSSLGDTLTTLDLRHNLLLHNITSNAFAGLEKVKNLNLSETDITMLTKDHMSHLKNLQFLDFTLSNLTEIKSQALEENDKLMKLWFTGAKLHTLPPKFLNSSNSIREIDLSGNPWLCDSELAPSIEWINQKNEQKDTPFNLVNENSTKCDRPYALQGEILTTLNLTLLEPYNEETDTTTPLPTTEPTVIQPEPKPEPERTGEPVVEVESEPEVTDHLDKSTTTKYSLKDIDHHERIVDDDDHSGSGWAAPLAVVAVLAVISILIIALVIFFIMKRNRATAPVADTEMRTTPTNGTHNSSSEIPVGKTVESERNQT